MRTGLKHPVVDNSGRAHTNRGRLGHRTTWLTRGTIFILSLVYRYYMADSSNIERFRIFPSYWAPPLGLLIFPNIPLWSRVYGPMKKTLVDKNCIITAQLSSFLFHQPWFTFIWERKSAAIPALGTLLNMPACE